MDDSLYTLDPIASITTYGPIQLESNLPFASSFADVLLMFYFNTRSPTLNSFALIFFPNALLSFVRYTFSCSMALILFSSSDPSCCNLAFLASSLDMSPYKEILRKGISNSSGKMDSSPYTIDNGVTPMVVRILVLYAHNAYGNYSCQSLLYLSYVLESILLSVLFVALS